MRDILFIGDEVTAAGFRMAGVESLAPRAEELAATVEAALGGCRVLVTTAAVQAALPRRLARALEASETPLLAVVPDVQEQRQGADMDAIVRRALGIEV